MKKIIVVFLYGLSIFLTASCQEKNATTAPQNGISETKSSIVGPFFAKYKFEGGCQEAKVPDAPIAEYVRRIFQDKKGNLWFGTNGEGVGIYDGTNLSYLTTVDGLAGNQITGFIDDEAGNVWIATDGGVSKYDGTSFVNYTAKNGLNHDWTWSILRDSKNTIWVGTLQGLCKFDGEKFNAVALPPTKVLDPQSHLSINRISSLKEDKKGILWIATDGCGVYKYDGKSFTNITTADGLCDNNVTRIIEDNKGNMWLGSMFFGLSKYDGKSFTNINETNKIGNNEVWEIFQDREGYVWFSSEGFGVYRFDGNKLDNYSEKEGLGVRAVQTIYQDKQGWIYVGGGGGLYRFEGDGFRHVAKDGPWGGC